MKKILFATVLCAASIAQVQAAPINRSFQDTAPTKSALTITFSGDCSGKITDTAAKIQVGLADDHANWQTSYFRFFSTGLNGLLMDDILYTQAVGSTTSISINKGVLNAKLSDTSARTSAGDITKIHSSGADSQIQCKNGQTLNQLLNDMGRSTQYVRDKTLTQNSSFTLKGKESPYAYNLSHTISGYLLVNVNCDISDSEIYKSTCKLTPKIKVTMKATASGFAAEQP